MTDDERVEELKHRAECGVNDATPSELLGLIASYKASANSEEMLIRLRGIALTAQKELNERAGSPSTDPVLTNVLTLIFMETAYLTD